ncbi:MbnP family protein [Sphingobacterium multivorum]|uniref:MbnP family protein n=1 Tax=Sphingobacterium multivorum TaxID=28454 RepID=UPI0028A8F995|nr:MbnP family protein [Sphingobacterium multivorum]
MKNNAIKLLMISLVMVSCSKSEDVANSVNLHFNNTFKNTTIVLGSADSPAATTNTSASGQLYQFSELKYVISNIRLIKADGSEIPYNVNDLDKGATVIDQAKAATLNYVLSNIPVGEYKQIKFGLGVKQEINTLDQLRFPVFYATAGANDTKMHWEWGTGYRFTKLEGFYGVDHKELSIHTGSTVNGTNGDESTYKQGVDAYRDITLNLPSIVTVGKSIPQINIRADFDKLLSGKTNTITLGANNAIPSIHSAVEMVKFVDNLGGNGSSDTAGMFTVEGVSN